MIRVKKLCPRHELEERQEIPCAKRSGGPEAAIVPKGNVALAEHLWSDGGELPGGWGLHLGVCGGSRTREEVRLQERSINQNRERDGKGSCKERRYKYGGNEGKME